MAIYRVVTKIILFQVTAVVEDNKFGNGLLAKLYFSVREARGIPRPPDFDNRPVHVFISKKPDTHFKKQEPSNVSSLAMHTTLF